MTWRRSLEGRRLPISDIAEPLISVTDVKHYFYCPRIIFFDHVLHAKPHLGSQQEDSRERHEDYVRKELRRKDAIYYSADFIGAEKRLFVPLCSSRLGLQGLVDLTIKTERGEYVPVDYKNMASDHGRAWMDHKYQLTAYAMLIDDNSGAFVRRSFVNYIPEDLIVGLEVTATMKAHVRRVLGHIRRIMNDEILPPVRVAR